MRTAKPTHPAVTPKPAPDARRAELVRVDIAIPAPGSHERVTLTINAPRFGLAPLRLRA